MWEWIAQNGEKKGGFVSELEKDARKETHEKMHQKLQEKRDVLRIETGGPSFDGMAWLIGGAACDGLGWDVREFVEVYKE